MRAITITVILLATLLVGAGTSFAESTNMDTSSLQPAGLQQLIDRHFAIWNTPDAAERSARYAAVYTPDFFVADHNGISVGYGPVGAAISHVQEAHPGFIFTPAPVEWNHGIARVTWGYGPKENPDLVRGEDVFTVRDGKLASARVFLSK
jgi:hypothetical protein